MAELTDGVRLIRGVGEQKARALERLDIRCLRDLISFFPRGYEDRTRICPIAETPLEEYVCVCAMAAGQPVLNRIRRGMELVKLRVVDESGALDITWFNQSYVRDRLIPGEQYVFYGKVGGNLIRRTMTNPIFEPESSRGTLTGRIMPLYRLTEGLSQKQLAGYVNQALELCGDAMPDSLPESLIQKYSLARAPFAYRNIHFPADEKSLALARRRLIFEELFVLACALGLMRGRRGLSEGLRIALADAEEFYAALPFRPTAAQDRAFREALADMCSGRPMNRLLQGDVGSGKTLVAAACAWAAYRSGCQTAFMAPTEILAEQHYSTLSAMLAPFGIPVVKLTGSAGARERREVCDRLASGEAGLAVGTHALLGEGVEFKSLGLVVTDEQHRFGVKQRSALTQKGQHPHVLVMSATPIPRTLALIIYGDLDISVLDELPPGRQTVDTFALDESMRERIWRFVRRLVGEGRQVFVVCPMIEENEALPADMKSAEELAEELRRDVFPELRVALVHGRMKGKEKDALMAAFAAGEYDIMVSTTVIEVGVDVPNAALMIIENAERFGLSQLHQLRGRVGRGKHKSYCVLFSSSKSEEARARLRIMTQTNDGFKISEEDLRLRGPGDFFGSRQHGLPEMHLADLGSDMNVLKLAQDEAAALLARDPELAAAENAPLLRRARELFSVRGEIFN